MLAHQGGWDELLLPAAIVLAILGWPILRRRRAASATSAPPRPSESPGAASCAFCDAPLGPDAERCPSCGFRVPERPASG